MSLVKLSAASNPGPLTRWSQACNAFIMWSLKLTSITFYLYSAIGKIYWQPVGFITCVADQIGRGELKDV